MRLYFFLRFGYRFRARFRFRLGESRTYLTQVIQPRVRMTVTLRVRVKRLGLWLRRLRLTHELTLYCLFLRERPIRRVFG